MDIQINKKGKTGYVKSVFSLIIWWCVLIFAFYFNYKFIDGSNFLDFIIFLTIMISFITYIVNLSTKYYEVYYNVSDDKIKKIEDILN